MELELNGRKRSPQLSLKTTSIQSMSTTSLVEQRLTEPALDSPTASCSSSTSNTSAAEVVVEETVGVTPIIDNTSVAVGTVSKKPSNISSSTIPFLPKLPTRIRKSEKHTMKSSSTNQDYQYPSDDNSCNATSSSRSFRWKGKRTQKQPQRQQFLFSISSPPKVLWLLLYSTGLFVVVLIYTEFYLWELSSSSQNIAHNTTFPLLMSLPQQSVVSIENSDNNVVPLLRTSTTKSSMINSTSDEVKNGSKQNKKDEEGKVTQLNTGNRQDREEISSGRRNDEEKEQTKTDTEEDANGSGDIDDTIPPIVHIVHSRFMQNQPQLVQLGHARLRLLEYFFLKSLSHQSSKNFVVIMKTDPNLDGQLKQLLIEMLQKSNIPHLLIASNENPKSIYHELKTIYQQQQQTLWMKENAVNGTAIWSGSFQDVMDYLYLSPPESDSNDVEISDVTTDRTNQKRENELVDVDKNDADDAGATTLYDDFVPRILETRLDADDGLHAMFIEAIQADAASKFEFGPKTWRIWCIGNHAEWQYHTLWKTTDDGQDNNSDGGGDNGDENDVGTLVALQATYCVTPGLTIGFPGDPTTIDEMPSTQKHERLQHLPMCSASDKSSKDNDKKTAGGIEEISDVEGEESQEQDEKSATMAERNTTDSQFLNPGRESDTSSTSDGCRSFLPLPMAALRARTPTSAGMLNVLTVNGTSFNKKYIKGAQQQREVQHKLWYVVKRLFGGFSKKRAKAIHEYFDLHMREIAQENLDGQCTHGHSCKNSSQIMLRSIVEGKTLDDVQNNR